MKIKTTKIQIFAVIITLFLLCSVSCNRTPDVSNFINKESFEKVLAECKKSVVEGCITKNFQQKVDKYCLDKKLSDIKCAEIKLMVTDKVNEYLKQKIEEERRTDEILKEAVRDLKQKGK